MSGGHRRLALLMIGGFAVTVFASVYMSSEPRTISDRAAYLVGSDLRVGMSGSRPPLGETVAALPGFESATYAFRAVARTSNYTLRPELLGIDPVTFPSSAWWRPDLDRTTLRDLLTSLARGETDGVRPEGRPRYLGLWMQNAGPPLRISARIADADDRAAFVDLGEVPPGEWHYVEGEIRFDRVPAYPLRLRELLISTARAYQGKLALCDLGFRQEGAAVADVVESFNEPRGWWPTSPITFARADSLQISTQPRRGASRAAELALALAPGQQVYLRPPPPTVPALLARSTLDRLGLHVGDTLRLTVDSSAVAVRLVGTVDSFPTLYPDSRDFLVASVDPLLDALGQASYWQPWPNEAWVRVAAAAASGDTRRLRELDSVTTVADRRAIESAAQRDPIWRSILAELLIGAYAAAALAVIALGLYFTATARGRHPEFAILRADGLPLRRLRASLRWEVGLVLAGSLLAGAALGLLLTWLIVPAIELQTGLLRPMPAPEVGVDPAAAVGATTVLVLLAAVTALLATRTGTQVDVVSELRLL